MEAQPGLTYKIFTLFGHVHGRNVPQLFVLEQGVTTFLVSLGTRLNWLAFPDEVPAVPCLGGEF